MLIRPEKASDAPIIARVIGRAFSGDVHSVGNEYAIVRNLRATDALSVSLVAEVNDQVRGYIAASPVCVGGVASSWYGLGPVAVDPSVQRQGIGVALVNGALGCLRSTGAAGCVVLGAPGYYRRFGFRVSPGLFYKSAPAEYFMAIAFGAVIPQGEVTYHVAFNGEA